jgi:hypothetical protein
MALRTGGQTCKPCKATKIHNQTLANQAGASVRAVVSDPLKTRTDSSRIARLPCAPHRYSAPRGSAAWRSPLASERQVPTFRTRASRWSHAVFMPVAARPVGRLPPSFVPVQQLESGFGDAPEIKLRASQWNDWRCDRKSDAPMRQPSVFRAVRHRAS